MLQESDSEVAFVPTQRISGNWLKKQSPQNLKDNLHPSYNASPAKKYDESPYKSPSKSPYKSPLRSRAEELIQKSHEMTPQKLESSSEPPREAAGVYDSESTPQKGTIIPVWNCTHI
jgi:hypothetical protein